MKINCYKTKNYSIISLMLIMLLQMSFAYSQVVIPLIPLERYCQDSTEESRTFSLVFEESQQNIFRENRIVIKTPTGFKFGNEKASDVEVLVEAKGTKSTDMVADFLSFNSAKTEFRFDLDCGGNTPCWADTILEKITINDLEVVSVNTATSGTKNITFGSSLGISGSVNGIVLANLSISKPIIDIAFADPLSACEGSPISLTANVSRDNYSGSFDYYWGKNCLLNEDKFDGTASNSVESIVINGGDIICLGVEDLEGCRAEISTSRYSIAATNPDNKLIPKPRIRFLANIQDLVGLVNVPIEQIVEYEGNLKEIRVFDGPGVCDAIDRLCTFVDIDSLDSTRIKIEVVVENPNTGCENTDTLSISSELEQILAVDLGEKVKICPSDQGKVSLVANRDRLREKLEVFMDLFLLILWLQKK